MRRQAEQDVSCNRRMIRIQGLLEINGWLALFPLPPGFNAVISTLGVAKILDNMEIGHNIMHGQFDWTNDPELRGKRFEQDCACPGEQWRLSPLRRTTATSTSSARTAMSVLAPAHGRRTARTPRRLLQRFRAFLMMPIFERGVAPCTIWR